MILASINCKAFNWSEKKKKETFNDIVRREKAAMLPANNLVSFVKKVSSIVKRRVSSARTGGRRKKIW